MSAITARIAHLQELSRTGSCFAVAISPGAQQLSSVDGRYVAQVRVESGVAAMDSWVEVPEIQVAEEELKRARRSVAEGGGLVLNGYDLHRDLPVRLICGGEQQMCHAHQCAEGIILTAEEGAESDTLRRRQHDPVNHPAHYTYGSIETIEAIEAWGLGYHLGNVVKYITRAGRKGDSLQDLEKARWYLNREIARL